MSTFKRDEGIELLLTSANRACIAIADAANKIGRSAVDLSKAGCEAYRAMRDAHLQLREDAANAHMQLRGSTATPGRALKREVEVSVNSSPLRRPLVHTVDHPDRADS